MVCLLALNFQRFRLLPVRNIRLSLPSVLLLKPTRHGDERGFFCETWNRRQFADAGTDLGVVQGNQSLSVAAGTLQDYTTKCHRTTTTSCCGAGKASCSMW